MKRLTIVLVACAALALGLVAVAKTIEVMGYANDDNLVPHTKFQGPNAVGALDYNAATRILTLNLADGPAPPSLFSTRFVPSGPYTTHELAPPSSLSINISVLSNDGGTYAGGLVANDFVLMGSVDVNGNSVIDTNESGTLLTGTLLQFGFNNLPATPGSDGTPDQIDFRFAVTGGILAPQYAGKDIGVLDVMKPSTWPNGNVGGTEFRDSFQANARGDVVPIPCGGSVGDFVWNDVNRNGVQDPGEPGLNGVTVRLRNPGNNSIIASMTSANGGQGNQAGFYNFTGLCLGSYTVEIDEASALAIGFVPTTSGVGGSTTDSNANFSPVTLVPGNYVTGDQTVDFGFKLACTGTIGDRVWHDQNRNGIQDPGEPGFQGWAVRLLDAGGTQIGAPIATGTNGSYQFVGLCAGGYRVDVVPPAGFALTFTNQGLDRTVDSNVPQVETITLATDFSTDSTIDFGYTGQCAGTIGDFVWLDTNHDGLQDANEPGIDGLTVTLNGPGGTKTTTTGVHPGDGTRHGFYQFTGACTGTYSVVVQPPAGFTPSVDNAGDDRAIDSNGPVTGGAAVVTLANDLGTDASIDFGFVSCPGQIGDLVWQDNNLNGVQDPGEPGYPGVVVNLRRPIDNAILQSTTTGLDGKYLFSGLCLADYRVEVVPPADAAVPPTGAATADLDSNENPSAVTLTLGAPTDLTIDFGFRASGTIGDRVWDDLDGDGVQDAGEAGLVGWTMSILGPNYSSTQVTGADGAYTFANLPEGSYVVCAIAMSGYAPTFDSDGVATPLCATRTVTALDLHPTDVDFGFRLPTSIGGRGWNDANGDGIRDGTEAPLTGWEVHISGPGGYNNSQVINATGSYLFAGLAPGTFVVCVTPLAGYTQTFDRDGLATPDCASLTVAAGENVTDVDFGYKPTVPPTGQLVSFVWSDLNNNGIQEFGEPGLPNAPVTISGPTLPAGYVTTSAADADGFARFAGLPAGTYTLTLPVPGGFFASPTGQGDASTTCPSGGGTGAQHCDSNGSPGGGEVMVSAPVTLATDSSADETIDFGLYTQTVGGNGGFANIGNFVWLDQNGNGLQDTGEPGVPGVTVNLSGPSGFTASTTTDANGRYLFRGLMAATYQVSVAATGYDPTRTGQGTAATVCAGGTGAEQCDSNPNPATVTVAERTLNLSVDFGLVRAPAGLSLAKAVDKTVATAGSNLVYTLTYKNSGGTSTTSVTISDTLPPGTTFVSATGGGVFNNDTVKWTIPTLAVGATDSVTLTVKLPPVFQACHVDGDNDDHERKKNGHHDGDKCDHERWKGCFSATTVTNNATIKSRETAPVTSNTVTTTVGTTANPILVLAKVVNKATANPGDTLVYTLAGKNMGNATETDVVATDVLPAGTTFVSATGGGVHTNGTVTWKIPSVPPNGIQAATLTVKLAASFPLGTTTLSNTYKVTSTQIPVPVESLAAVTTVTVVPKPVLTLTKSVSAATVAKGGTLVYTLAYKNTGPGPATNVVLTDVLPDKTSFTSATASGINGGSNGIKWTLGTVASGASGSVTVTVKVSPSTASKTVLTNTAKISSTEVTTAVVSNAVTTKVN